MKIADKIILLFISTLFFAPPTTLALFEKDIESCSLQNNYGFCEALKEDLYSCTPDNQYMIDTFKTYNENASQHKDRKLNTYLIAQYIEFYNSVDDMAEIIINKYNSQDEFRFYEYRDMNTTVEYGAERYYEKKEIEKNQKAQTVYKTDQEKIKEFCVNEIERAKKEIYDLVPVNLKKEFEKGIKSDKNIYTQINNIEQGKYQSFFKKIFNKISLWFKNLF